MHGRGGGEHRKLIRHMWSVPSTTTTKTVAGVVDSNGFSASCFYKDGRKISVGDSALFKPAEDSPPFVGIIRSLTSEKESNLKLRVNWLYRPAEVKLPKGVALEAAPNEVFYSFHSDEIPAASLLHPCKVSFLRKGVELPPGVSSFVCRRVYDITNKCLWWLTDQDFIDDRQTEINQLLHKTRIEMYGSEQHHGPRSPKPANGSAATSPLKHSPDSVQNSSSNLSSHRKGKKRERGEQSFEAIKRDRSSRPDDGDSGQLRSESLLNLEIARLSEKGGLTDSDTVMRLVRLMQPEKSDKKIGLTGRSMLAGIIAATDKVDCLNQFVQLRGLFVLNEWLQEVHKGKIGDSGNLKSSDKSVDDFLLVLLRALDKLPVNLNALQMCNIGKSVNHLRTHKNSEIQKKARSLVDMWKKRVEAEMKRVEAEMNINDVKCGSNQAVAWPGRSQHDSSHGGNRQSSGSDAAIRSSVTHHSSLKAAPVKLVAGESNPKSASAQPVGARSTLSPTSTTDKDGQSKVIANGGCSDHQTVAREERSSSSSQSHNSQCSSDQAKNMVPHGKEGTKGSRSFNNNVGSGSKHRKSANGPVSSVQKDSASNKSPSVVKNSVSEKVSYNATDASPQENNNHKLIVKIPNRGRGLAQSITGGSLEDNSCKNSRASSPVLSEKQDQDASARGNKLDSYQYHEVDGSSTSVSQRTNETRRVPNVSKIACSPSRSEMKSRKSHDSSFSSMNALIESCAKFSEANVPISAADDVGMNLLASVAAREISRSGIVSPAVSPHRNSKLGETSSSSHVGNQKQLHGDDVIQGGQSTDVADTDNDIHVAGNLKVDEECNKLCDTKTEKSPENVEDCLKSSGTLDDEVGTAAPSVSLACTTGKSEGDLGAESVDKKVPVVKEETQNESPVASHGLVCSLEANDKVKVASLNDDSEKKAQLDTGLYQSDKVKVASLKKDDEKGNVGEGLQDNMVLEQKSFVVALQSDPTHTNKKSSMVSCSTSQHMASATLSNFKSKNSDGIDTCGLVGPAGNRISDKGSDFPSEPGKEGEPGVCRADVYQGSDCNDQNLDNKEVPAPDSLAVVLPEAEVNSAAEGIKSVVVEEDTKVESGSATDSVAVSPVPGRSAAVVKLGFDLNEGFNVDDGKNGEPADLASGPCRDNVCSVSPLQLPVSSTSCSLPASVTVASAAKGPFVPADDLLWNKREFGWILGWKGSAATSAFRPAEPRKVTEAPFGLGTAPLPDAPVYRPGRFPLDIDLNVTDESSGQECIVRNDPGCELLTTASLRSSGGLDLDLNKVDEAPDMAYGGQQVAGNVQRAEVSAPHVKSSTSNVHSNTAAPSGKRDFDLNNGPAAEEPYVEHISYGQHNRGNITLQPSLGPRINNSDAGNFFSWYPPGTNYSVSVTPSALPDREAFSILGMGGGPQRALGGPNSALSFNSDAYRGSVLSSSTALPFHPAPFQYPFLPYGTSFPLSSPALAGGSSGYMDPATGGRVSAIPSQLVGNAAAVSFQYPHAYVVSRSIPDVGNNGVIESNHKWGKQGLDLNSGPGVLDVEGRDESLPTVTRQVSTMSPQSLAEEQARMYCMGGGQPKRKEPEGGWNIDKLNIKQSPWR